MPWPNRSNGFCCSRQQRQRSGKSKLTQGQQLLRTFSSSAAIFFWSAKVTFGNALLPEKKLSYRLRLEAQVDDADAGLGQGHFQWNIWFQTLVGLKIHTCTCLTSVHSPASGDLHVYTHTHMPATLYIVHHTHRVPTSSSAKPRANQKKKTCSSATPYKRPHTLISLGCCRRRVKRRLHLRLGSATHVHTSGGHLSPLPFSRSREERERVGGVCIYPSARGTGVY